MKKFLIKLLLYNIDYRPQVEASPIKSIVSAIIIYGVGPFAIILFFGNFWVQFAIACLVTLFMVYSVFRASITSQLRGAELALRNPPAIGETWVEMKDGDSILWSSEKFTFSPGIQSGPISIQTDDIEVPGREADWQQWHDAYYFVISQKIGQASEEQILAELGRLNYPASHKSYMKIRRAGEAGRLVTFKG